MNKSQLKIAITVLLTANASFIASNSFAQAELSKLATASTIDRVTASAKHKALTEKTPSIERESADITTETQKAIVALDKHDTKNATTFLQGVSAKLDKLLAEHPEMDLVPAYVEADVYDFRGTNQQVTHAIDEARDLLRHGKLQSARYIMSGLASEIRITTTSIPLGTYSDAIKKIIPLIESGKIDQAAVDLNSVLDTLVVSTELMPIPVLQAEALLTVAAELEHRDDLSKAANRDEILTFTDASKDKLELAQLLGYGEKNDYKLLYKEIDAIHTALFSEKSAAVWQKVKTDLGQFKDRLKGLGATAKNIGHPAK